MRPRSLYETTRGGPRRPQASGVPVPNGSYDRAMSKLELTVALERLDRHVPFLTGTVPVPGEIDLRVLEVGVGDSEGRRDGNDRHGRMFRDREFDVCEQSLASYIVGRSRGEPFIATPVFPRRLFSQNQMFVTARSGIRRPRDLIGRRIALVSWQTTLCVQAKGDLRSEYGVAWEQIHWYTLQHEELPWDPPAEVSIHPLPPGADLAGMLEAGELDGLFHPSPPLPVFDRTGLVHRLFADPQEEVCRYYRRVGHYPIMHVLVFHENLAVRAPWLARVLLDMWEEAKRQAARFYSDPGFSLLVFARNELERQRCTLGDDLFPSGLRANRTNLERFMGYLQDQRLLARPMTVEQLFDDTTLDS